MRSACAGSAPTAGSAPPRPCRDDAPGRAPCVRFLALWCRAHRAVTADGALTQHLRVLRRDLWPCESVPSALIPTDTEDYLGGPLDRSGAGDPGSGGRREGDEMGSERPGPSPSRRWSPAAVDVSGQVGRHGPRQRRRGRRSSGPAGASLSARMSRSSNSALPTAGRTPASAVIARQRSHLVGATR